MRIERIFGVLVAVFMPVLVCVGMQQITVTGTRVNVRAVSDPRSEIVGQVLRGDILNATGRKVSGMVEIVPPVAVSAWVYGELIRDGKIAATSSVRSGPGIGYRPIGKLTEGARVEILQRAGDWVKIAPPESCRVWISADYVAFPGESSAESEVAAPVVNPVTNMVVEVAVATNAVPIEPPLAAAPDNVVIDHKVPGKVVGSVSERTAEERVRAEVERDDATAVLDTVAGGREAYEAIAEHSDSDSANALEHPVVDDVDVNADVVSAEEREAIEISKRLNLVSGVAQGKPVVVFGTVKMAGFLPLRRPSSYKLLITGGYKPGKTACWLLGERELITGYMGQTVRVEGKKYWVKGVREPAVLISEICKPEPTR